MNTLENVKAYYSSRSYANLSQKAYDMLLEMILSLILEPDHIYSEAELSKKIDIGRTPVRDAVHKLQSNMLVDVIPRGGIKISPLKLEDFYLQIEVRRVLEKLIITKASKFATASERQRLETLLLSYKDATKNKDDIAALRLDMEFHDLVASCARNPFAKRALEPFQILEQRLYYIQYDTEPEITGQINELHFLLMREIIDGNAEKACDYFETMIDCTEKLVQTRISMLKW